MNMDYYCKVAENDFPRIVKDKLAFLVENFGFDFEPSERGSVKFKSKQVYLRVTYEYHRSHEIGVSMGFKSASMDCVVSFDTIRAYYRGDVDTSFPSYMADSAEEMESCLQQVALFLEEDVEKLLRGEKAEWKALGEFELERSEQYTKKMVMAQPRKRANKAWKEEDYERFVRIMEPHLDDLSELEKKRFDYAERQIERTK